jgi:DNA-binding IclR family transcriptional regulator
LADVPTGSGGQGESGKLGALRHGLAVFDMFDAGRQTVTVAEIGRHLGIHKSTASRIAQNLVLSGYLVPATNAPGFRLSGKFARLGAIAAVDATITTVSAEHVKALVDDVGETCHVAVLEGRETVTVVLVDGTYAVRMHSCVGKRNDAHTTAAGKVLLAGLEGSTLDMLYPDRALKQVTQQTIGSKAELKEQLAIVRRHGYAYDDEELEPGLRCVAAPIADHSGRVVAALTIACAASRLGESRVDHYVDKVKECALRISLSLGAPEDEALLQLRSG